MTRESPTLRQAIIRVTPDYFSWSQAEQEHYRVAIPKADAFRLNQYLFQRLFGITVHSDQELTAAWEQLSYPQLDVLNAHRLPISGIGEDCFSLNEGFAEGTTILSFETLHDYDCDDHAFQEQSRQKAWPDHVIQPYHGSLSFRWARLFVEDEFRYATLSCAGYYVHSKAEGFGMDYLHELIPHEYVWGRHHGKREEGGFRWDSRIDANGREAELEELTERFWKYFLSGAAELAADWDQRNLRAAYIIEENEGFGDNRLDFIFTDREALKAVRFCHFMVDVRAIEQDSSYVQSEIETEQQRIRNYLDEQLADINDNFDPSVRKLKPKKKVFLSPRAERDLKGLDLL